MSVQVPMILLCYCGRPTRDDGRGGYVCPEWRWWRPWRRHRHGALVIPPGGVVQMAARVTIPSELLDRMLEDCPECHHPPSAACHRDEPSECECTQRPQIEAPEVRLRPEPGP